VCATRKRAEIAGDTLDTHGHLPDLTRELPTGYESQVANPGPLLDCQKLTVVLHSPFHGPGRFVQILPGVTKLPRGCDSALTDDLQLQHHETCSLEAGSEIAIPGEPLFFGPREEFLIRSVLRNCCPAAGVWKLGKFWVSPGRLAFLPALTRVQQLNIKPNVKFQYDVALTFRIWQLFSPFSSIIPRDIRTPCLPRLRNLRMGYWFMAYTTILQVSRSR
jgi:hypothetical protein